MRPWICLVLLCTGLAGCAEGGENGSTDEDDAFADFDELEVDDETGLIRGVVVDAAIFPIVGATVRLEQTGDEVQTNEKGAFVFAELEPGNYFLHAKALGYRAVQSSAEVVAGVAQPPVVKIQLPVDPAGTPYHIPHYFAGFIQCGTNVVALCGGVRDFTGLGDDTYSSLYDTQANITHLQSEMVWSNTQQLGDSFSVLHRYATRENYEGGFYDGGLESGSGPSPLLVVTDVEDYNENNVGEDYEFLISIFAGESNAVPGVGVALEQNYEMFIHEFHGYLPPEGWRFSQDPEVPPPQ